MRKYSYARWMLDLPEFQGYWIELKLCGHFCLCVFPENEGKQCHRCRNHPPDVGACEKVVHP